MTEQDIGSPESGVTKGCELPTWVLSHELRSSVRAVGVLLAGSPLRFLYYILIANVLPEGR